MNNVREKRQIKQGVQNKIKMKLKFRFCAVEPLFYELTIVVNNMVTVVPDVQFSTKNRNAYVCNKGN